MKTQRIKTVLRAVHHYTWFFLFMSFLITCCMLLFLNTLSAVTDMQFTPTNVRAAATVTFCNVILLSLLCTVIDAVRRRITVDRPVQQIVDAAQRMMQGDFSVRIPPLHGINRVNGLDKIVDCFNRMAEELSGIETLRTDFIANVSHELKTPLAVMQNYCTMLSQPALPQARRQEYIDQMSETCGRLAGLVTNILRLSKLENQRIFPSKEQYDLGEQLRQCLLGHEEAWTEKALEVDTDIPDGVLLEADAELLALVWNNLISNAVKFNTVGGRLELSLKVQAGAAVVRIADTGCGISPQVGPHIFEKFYQGDVSHADRGNGLGLALVRRIVDIVGGDIAVSSQVGQGSTFTVRLRGVKDEKSC